MVERVSHTPPRDTEPARPNRRWRVILSLAVLALFVLIGRHHFDQLVRLATASPMFVGGLVGAWILARLLRAGALKLLLTCLGKQVRLGECFLLAILVAYANLLIPKSGLGAPAVYLKRRYGLSFAHFGPLTIMLALLQTAAVGLIGLPLIIVRRGVSPPQIETGLLILFAVAAGGGVILTLIRPAPPRFLRGRLRAFLDRCAEGWRLLGARYRLMAAVFVLSAAMILAQTLKLACAFRAIGIEANFSGVLLATLLSDLALLISITPGALGFREAAVTTSAAWLGCSLSAALAAAILDRVAVTLVIVVFGQVGVWRLSGGGRVAETMGP